MLESAKKTEGPVITTLSEAGFGATDLWLIFMTLVWGTNFTVIKFSLEDLKPLTFTSLRFVIASLAMLAITWAARSSLRVERGDFVRLFGLAVLTNVVYQTFFMMGMARTRAGNAALILATTPLFTAVIGRLRGQERFTPGGTVGLLLAFLGIALIVLAGHKDIGSNEGVLGDSLLIAATLCWSAYTNLAHRFVHTYGSLTTTTIMMVTGTPVLLLVSASSLISQDWSVVRPASWVGVVYSGLLSIALAYIIWNHGVRRIGGTRTAVYGNLTPVVAVIVAWPALGEVPTLGQLIGAAVILLGIYLVRGGMIHSKTEKGANKLEDEVSLKPGCN